jgi:dTDP-glucose 4,6-dehydratase
MGTFMLLEAARKHEIKKFIQISTDEVYGEAPGRPSVETDALMPKSPYAASKAGADRLAFSYCTTYGVPVTITRCSNNYGPYQYPEKLIPLFATNVLEGKKLPVYGSGMDTRDWIYVDDHCSAIDAVLQRDDLNGEVFNIGTGEEKSVLDIASIILDVLSAPRELLEHVPDRLGHVQRHAVDSSRLRRMVDWKPRFDFEEAMVRTVEWYRNHPEWWRPIKSGEFRKYYEKQYHKN